MDVNEVDRRLQSVRAKIVSFAQTLDADERDVLAAILTLAARNGGALPESGEPPSSRSEPDPVEVVDMFKLSRREILAHLPRRPLVRG